MGNVRYTKILTFVSQIQINLSLFNVKDNCVMYVLGLLDMKTDVYIFGMILLELLMGSKDRKKFMKQQGLDFWTTSLLPDSYKIEEIIDPRLGNDYSANAATQMGTLINQCTAHDTKKRPLMQQVLDGLNYIAEIKD